MPIRTFLTIVTLGLLGTAFADDREKARARMPKQIEWQGHYLVLQGENFLPVERAISTPNITFYEVEEGYLPSGKTTLESEIEGCGSNARKGQSVLDTGEARAALTAEAAVDYASAEAARARNRKFCPEHLGESFGSGSYVYDDAFNQLAGQEFDDGTDYWRGWRLHNEPVESNEVIIFGQGGAKREDDPALDVFKYDNGMIVDVLFDPNTYNGRREPGLGETGTPGAPELPVTVTYETHLKDAVQTTDDGLADIGQISDALDQALKAAADKAVRTHKALIISRGATAQTYELNEERLEVIRSTVRNRLGDEADISVVSFGTAVPICADEDPVCWHLNRSTILYLYPGE